ncbi:MAG: carboxypeptidase-like regulatory domain-containing protein [Bacteroidia bacterium]|nr:carboxypeptidase-like regulatory domain-containing protein [Bacteroidia bacterium]
MGLAAQVTKVTGKVVDAETREGLPFVNVVFRKTKLSTTTDFDGKYSISASVPVDSLVVSYIGYVRYAVAVKRGQSQVINIELKSDVKTFDAVNITPGENPAHKILRKVWANKEKNDKDALEAYEYEVYNKVEFDLNNIPKEYKDKKALKPVKFIFDYIDSTNAKEKPYLPLFISESLSDYYYQKSPRKKKEVIKASRISGLQNEESVTQFMGDMYQNVNLYDNNFEVFAKTFVSPISENGILFYKYYLIDSVYIDGVRCYHIQFKQRRKQECVFNGNMWIADTAFALKRVEMSLPDDVNLNYVNTLSFIQEYGKAPSGRWMLVKDRIIVDFAIREKKTGFYGRKTTSYKNFILDQPRPDDFWTFGENLFVEKDAAEKTEEYWKNARHDSLSKNEQQIYHMVDTIQSLPIYKSWETILVTAVGGYWVKGPVELGPYYKILSFNSIEGLRLRVGGRTSNDFSRWVEINGFAAYGFDDEKFKYNAEFKSFITKNPRQIVYLNYKDDYEVLGQSWNAFTPDNIISSLFRRTPLTNMTRVQQGMLTWEYEPFDGWNNKLYLVNRNMTPLGTMKYIAFNDNFTRDTLSGITTSEIRIRTRFAYDEKYLEGTFLRTSTGTKYPVLSVAASFGIKGVMNGDYEYQKLVVNVTDRFYINPFGYVDYIVEGGQVFGKVPYPLLELHGGNETYVYDTYAFNMMNYYEFASDRYLTVQMFHHMGGFLFNKVPLLRKLKWREVFTVKALIGEVSSKNLNVFEFPATLNQLNNGPYYEVSAGVENVFKIFRFDALWRLSYVDDGYRTRYESSSKSRVPVFGIRGAMQFIF